MARGCPIEVPAGLRDRLEAARLDLLALFRALDRMDLAPLRSHSGWFDSFLSSTPILPRRFGPWINLRQTLNLTLMPRDTLAGR
jgi:hypothetical protein